MLERVDGRFCLAQPMLVEQAVPNALIYLPGNPAADMYPLQERSDDYKLFDPIAVNASHWIWGTTRSFLRSVLAGEGFEIVIESEGPPLPNPRWSWWGCVAERTAVPEQRWSRCRPWAGLYTDDP
jgi:hypothetical protein